MSAPAFPRSLGLAARLGVGAVLVYAGSIKAAGPSEEFALIISAYQILPQDMSLTLATFLPYVEMLIGWSLILGLHLRAAAAAAGAIFAGFLLSIASLGLRSIELPNCGCFGDSIHLTAAQAFLVDACLASLCLVAWKSVPAPWSLDHWIKASHPVSHGKR